MRIGVNILFLIPNQVGGTETYTLGLLTALEKEDHKNQYYYFCSKENYATFESDSAKVKKIKCFLWAKIRPFRILWEQFILPIQAYFLRLDLIISTGYTCPLFSLCKSIVFIYDLNWYFHPEEFSLISRFFWKYLVSLSAKRADMIITSSNNSKKDIKRILKISENKIKVICGAVDLQKFKPIKDKNKLNKIKQKYNLGNKYILTVSASYKFKNLTVLIDSFKKINENFPDIKLIIVGLPGRGSTEILEKIKEYSLSDRVIIAGWVPDEDLPALYSGAELYVHPSLYEGFGFPILEAMACGCPVVASNAASLPELVGEAGITINAVNVEEISDAILNVIESRSLREKLTIDGLSQVEKFTWKKSIIKLNQYLLDGLK